ncbi:MAG: cytochrome c551/c552, partial [Flavobacteriaceae bacterium]
VTLGVGGWAQCESVNTKEVRTYMLPNPVPPKDLSEMDKGKMAYYGICAGCHSYNNVIVGPTITDIQMIYKDNPQGIVDYITHPIHKRQDFPEMPPQTHLPDDVKMAVAEYVLKVKK